eukprot:2919-Chlamydomonas_euryale.AAC.2
MEECFPGLTPDRSIARYLSFSVGDTGRDRSIVRRLSSSYVANRGVSGVCKCGRCGGTRRRMPPVVTGIRRIWGESGCRVWIPSRRAKCLGRPALPLTCMTTSHKATHLHTRQHCSRSRVTPCDPRSHVNPTSELRCATAIASSGTTI